MDRGIINYEDLLAKKQGETITYLDLLQTTEWRDFRGVLIHSDSHCSICKRSQLYSFAGYNDLKFYPVPNGKPWPEFVPRNDSYLNFTGTVDFADPFYFEYKCANERYETPILFKLRNSLINLLEKDPKFSFGHYLNEDKSFSLHAHHKLYYGDKLPWEYTSFDMQVVCMDCHQKIHAEKWQI